MTELEQELLDACASAVSAIQELYHGLPPEKQERVLYYGDIIGRAIRKDKAQEAS